MKHETDMDQLLRQALSPYEEPDDRLNQKILNRAKETEDMSRRYHKRIPAVAMAAAAVLFVGSITTVAAWKYLTPDKVAEMVEDKTLAAAFQSEDAIAVNETQEYGNYRITLLGMVSGKNISQYIIDADDAKNVRDDRTYVVAAIENKDGSPRPDTGDEAYGEDPFFVSPLIKGQDPNWYNIVTMNGGYSELVQDGVQYRIIELDNVEIFADKTLYLAVSSGTFYDNNAYVFNEDTGEITRNESYEGVNALFRMPIDEAKADKEKADAYLQQLEQNLSGEGSGSKDTEDISSDEKEESDFMTRVSDKIAGWTEEEMKQNCQLLEDLTQTLTPDKDGNISYSYQIGGEEGGEGSKAVLSVDNIFENHQTGTLKTGTIYSGNEENEVYIEAFILNEDGTVTLQVYQYSENK